MARSTGLPQPRRRGRAKPGDGAALSGAPGAAADGGRRTGFNRQRVLEEVAVLVERSDITEELTRMTTHIGHFRELLRRAAK